MSSDYRASDAVEERSVNRGAAQLDIINREEEKERKKKRKKEGRKEGRKTQYCGQIEEYIVGRQLSRANLETQVHLLTHCHSPLHANKDRETY